MTVVVLLIGLLHALPPLFAAFFSGRRDTTLVVTVVTATVGILIGAAVPIFILVDLAFTFVGARYAWRYLDWLEARRGSPQAVAPVAAPPTAQPTKPQVVYAPLSPTSKSLRLRWWLLGAIAIAAAYFGLKPASSPQPKPLSQISTPTPPSPTVSASGSVNESKAPAPHTSTAPRPVARASTQRSASVESENPTVPTYAGVSYGATMDDVRAALGAPVSRTVSASSTGVVERWRYVDGTEYHFIDGRVADIK